MAAGHTLSSTTPRQGTLLPSSWLKRALALFTDLLGHHCTNSIDFGPSTAHGQRNGIGVLSFHVAKFILLDICWRPKGIVSSSLFVQCSSDTEGLVCILPHEQWVAMTTLRCSKHCQRDFMVADCEPGVAVWSEVCQHEYLNKNPGRVAAWHQRAPIHLCRPWMDLWRLWCLMNVDKANNLLGAVRQLGRNVSDPMHFFARQSAYSKMVYS